ncbi:bactofilin family protein [Neotabrizicola sp. VNH66]|uniref:bactofilin family protein n=1 Tax=Neotabrizicola sp. VNH66 TaxID=3400918 RepID=UPI003C000AAD
MKPLSELEHGVPQTPSEPTPLWPEPAAAALPRSVLGGDLIIEGDVTSEGPVDLQGRVIGSVRAPDVVIVGSGQVEGAVTAHQLSVQGTVSGQISARQVQLAPGAVVHADVVHEQIAIEAGAELEGRLRRRS